jgi:hypothetical protein
MNRRLCVFVCLAMSFCGCQQRVEHSERVFASDDGEYVLTIVLDMSGSFRSCFKT